MAYETYRVRKRFQWGDFHYGPTGDTLEDKSVQFRAGDVWVVEEGHPNKDAILRLRYATYDASIPSVDELMKDERFARLVHVRKVHDQVTV